MSTEGQFRRQAVSEWLAKQGLRDPQQVSPEDHAALTTLLAPHAGFGIFWSILAYSRAINATFLQNLNMASPDALARASQYQGMIKVVDEIRELILNIADPLGEGSESPQRAGELNNG